MKLSVNRQVTPPPSCGCGVALRLRTSVTEGACCCCRRSCPGFAADEACRICSTVLWDFDGAGELCLRCMSSYPAATAAGAA